MYDKVKKILDDNLNLQLKVNQLKRDAIAMSKNRYINTEGDLMNFTKTHDGGTPGSALGTANKHVKLARQYD